MERTAARFPRFSVSAVTLSYFRRPHRNSKVRFISGTEENPAIRRSRQLLPEKSLASSLRVRFIQRRERSGTELRERNAKVQVR